MDKDLSVWQKILARLGTPNDNGGANYSDAELRYYLRNVLNGYDEFIPTPVVRDAWRGARIREAQPRYGDPSRETLEGYLREALNTRLELRDSPTERLSPTGADIKQMWGSTLSPTDAILQQAQLRKQQEKERDYYPPIEY